jgi:hypothetical protein
MRSLSSAVALPIALTFLLGAAVAGAEQINCTPITSVPTVITDPGIYCLTQDMGTSMTSGSAIEIQANNVVLDLNDHKLRGVAAGSGTLAYGVHAFQRRNITIRNGTVRGFYFGIWLQDTVPNVSTQGHVVEGVRAELNTYVGIEVDGIGSIVRNSQVLGTGGSTGTGALNAIGIWVAGPAARVLNNDVYDTHANVGPAGGGNAIGVLAGYGTGSVVEGNRVGNPILPADTTSFGVFAEVSSNLLVVNNRLTTMSFGIYFGGASTGKYRDTLTSGLTSPFAGGTDAGNNN